MSLINKVLTDLDQRHAVNGDSNSNAENESLLKGLPFSAVPQNKNTGFRYMLMSVLVVVLVISVGAGLYFYQPSANKNVANTIMVPEAQEIPRVAQPAVARTPIKTVVVDRIEPEVAIKQPQSTEATQPDKQVTKRPPARSVKSKPKKTVLAVAERESSSGFNKNTIPLRSDQRAEVAYQLAYDQLLVGNQRKAERSLRQALAIEPAHIKSRELLSGVYIKQGRWVEVSELLRKGLVLSPGHRTFSKLYARALMQLQQNQRAISVLKQHAPPIKSDPDYYALLAALYQRQKDHAAAVETYQNIVEIQPKNGVWWVGLGISLEALGKSEQASQAYFQARNSGNLLNEIAHFTNNRLAALAEIGYPAK